MGSSFPREYRAIVVWTWTAFQILPNSLTFSPHLHARIGLHIISLTPCARHMPVPACISANVTDHVGKEARLSHLAQDGVSPPLMARRCQQFAGHVNILKLSTLGCYFTFRKRCLQAEAVQGTRTSRVSGPNQWDLGLRLACAIFHDELQILINTLWSQVPEKRMTRGHVVVTVIMREKSKS